MGQNMFHKNLLKLQIFCLGENFLQRPSCRETVDQTIFYNLPLHCLRDTLLDLFDHPNAVQVDGTFRPDPSYTLYYQFHNHHPRTDQVNHTHLYEKSLHSLQMRRGFCRLVRRWGRGRGSDPAKVSSGGSCSKRGRVRDRSIPN